MFNLKAYLKNRKEKQEKKEFNNGFNWAAGELLKGKPVSHPLSCVECAIHFCDYSKFDEGIEEAVRAWELKEAK